MLVPKAGSMAPTDTTPVLALSEIGWVPLNGFDQYSSEPPLTSSSSTSPAVPDPRAYSFTPMFTVLAPPLQLPSTPAAISIGGAPRCWSACQPRSLLVNAPSLLVST